MGLPLAVLACIVAFVLLTMLMASSRPLRRDPRRVGHSGRVLSRHDERPAVTVPFMERLWFRLSAKLVGPAAIFAFLILLVRNIQNGIAWNDASWAVILPFGLVISVGLLVRMRRQWDPEIDGA